MKVAKVDENLKIKRNRTWTTKLVNQAIERLDIGDIVENPFVAGDQQWRQPDITFEYTEEEIIELRKCAEDVVYFANKYAYSMTDEGIQKITLRDYQIDRLRDLQNNRFNVYMASRQIGKCFLHFINIKIRNKKTGKIESIEIGEFFKDNLKRKKTVLEKIKNKLWKLYSYLSRS